MHEPVRTVEAFQALVGREAFDILSASLQQIYMPARIGLSGSLANGFGNIGSDIDVVVIDEPGQSTEPDRWYSTSLARYVDILPISISDVQSFVEAGPSQCEFDEFWRPRRYFDHKALERLHRFRIAIPLSNAAFYSGERQRLDNVLPYYLAVSFYRDAAAYWTDMTGAALSGDTEQVFKMVEIIGRALAGAAAALGGETATHEKWLAKKVQRCDPSFAPVACMSIQLTRDALCRGQSADGLIRTVAAIMCDLSGRLAGVDNRAEYIADFSERFEYSPSGRLRRVTLADHEAVLVRD